MSGRRSRIQVRPNVGSRPSGPKKTEAAKIDEQVEVTIPLPHSSIASATSSQKTTVEGQLPVSQAKAPSFSVTAQSPTKRTRTSSRITPDENQEKISATNPVPNVSDELRENNSKCEPVGLLEAKVTGGSGEVNIGYTENTKKPVSSGNIPGPKTSIGRRSRIKPQVQIRRGKPVSTNDEKDSKTLNAQHELDNYHLSKETDVTNCSAPVANLETDTTNAEISQKTTVTINKIDDICNQNSPVSDNKIVPVPLTIIPLEELHDVVQSVDVIAKDENTTVDGVSSALTKTATKRGRFAKARPNIAEAERRRARLSSFSEHEDSPSVRKHKPAIERESISGDMLIEANEDGVNNHVKVHGLSSVTSDTADAKPQEPKVKRRVPAKLSTLVSENRNKFTVRDLIHMNPVHNPMKRYLKPEVKKQEKVQGDSDSDEIAERDEAVAGNARIQSPRPTATPVHSPRVADKLLVSPRAAEDDDVDGEKEDEAMLVPQIMIGPDGQIMLNDASLVVANPATQPDTAMVEDMEVVEENDNYDPTFYYKKRTRSMWDMKDTMRFFVALSTVGTDFSLMGNLFPKRSRTELKKKFKLEERKHKELVDHALDQRRELDLSIFEPSEDEGSDAENVPEEGSLTQAVAMTLKKESENSKKSTGENKTKQNTGKNNKTAGKNNKTAGKKSANSKGSETGKKDTKVTEKKSKTKKKKRKKSSIYYDSGSSSEDDDKEKKLKKLKGSETAVKSTTVDHDSADEASTIDRLTANKTRAGRQPKRAQTYEVELAETNTTKRQRKKKKTETHMPQSPFSNLPQGPLVNIPSKDVTQKVIEDTETGQRLLLVKSPPPMRQMGTKEGGEFVHVYLLSPSAHQRKASTTSQDDGDYGTHFTPRRFSNASQRDHAELDRPRAGSSSQGCSENVIEIFPDVGSSVRTGISDNEERRMTLLNRNVGLNSDIIGSRALSESATDCTTPVQIIVEDQDNSTANSENNVTFTELKRMVPVHDMETNDPPTMKMEHSERAEVLDKISGQISDEIQGTFDNAEITTITRDDGEIVEILIEPSMFGIVDPSQEHILINVPISQPDSVAVEHVMQTVPGIDEGHLKVEDTDVKME